MKAFTRAAIAACFCIFTINSFASSVTISKERYVDFEQQTTNGQNFIFDFDPIKKGNVTNGRFTIFARGDYSLGPNSQGPDEYIHWGIDGTEVNDTPFFKDSIVEGFASPNMPGANVRRVYNNAYDTRWSQSFKLSDEDLLAIVDDGLARIFLDLSSHVGDFCRPSWVGVKLKYEIAATPIPAPLALFFSAGAMLFGFRKLKLKARKAVS